MWIRHAFRQSDVAILPNSSYLRAELRKGAAASEQSSSPEVVHRQRGEQRSCIATGPFSALQRGKLFVMLFVLNNIEAQRKSETVVNLRKNHFCQYILRILECLILKRMVNFPGLGPYLLQEQKHQRNADVNMSSNER